MTAPKTGRELLEYLLADQPLTEGQLREVITAIEEGQHIDYKDGVLIKKETREKARRTIREYVSGFANADGGVLVLGVTRSTQRQISPCHPIGSEPVDKWAENQIHDMAGLLSPLPRFQTVATEAGPVLLIAVARAPELIPCVEAHRNDYFLRINQSTLRVPDYLLSDLVLGRRRHPQLDLILNISQGGTDSRNYLFANIHPWIENVGLSYAENVKSGFVAWSLQEQTGGPFPASLRSYLDVVEPDIARGQWTLRHIPTALSRGPSASNVSPFERLEALAFNYNIPCYRGRIDRSWLAAYVLAQGSPPTWFQVTVDSFEGIQHQNSDVQERLIDLKRVANGRPVVRFEVGGGTPTEG